MLAMNLLVAITVNTSILNNFKVIVSNFTKKNILLSL